MPPSELPNRWKRRPKIQVPPLSLSNTTRRPLNLKNAALWPSQPRTLNLKTAPQDANIALEFRNHNRAPSKPKNAALWAPKHVKTAPQDASAAPEFVKHNQAPSKPEKCRPLSFPTKDSEPENGAPKMWMPPLSSPTTTGRPLNLKNAALWACHQVKMAPKDASAAHAHDDLDYPPAKDCALLARNAVLWLLLAKKDGYWRFCAFGAGAPLVIGEGLRAPEPPPLDPPLLQCSWVRVQTYIAVWLMSPMCARPPHQRWKKL